MIDNPYSPPSAESAAMAVPRRESRGDCPICDAHVPWRRKLLPVYRCRRCGARLESRPQLRYSLPVLVICLAPGLAMWFYIKADPWRVRDVGYWLMLPPILTFLGPWLAGQLLGLPSLLCRWRWAPKELVVAQRTAWIEGNG